MVKRFLFIACIILLCLTFVRFALGASVEIDTFQLTYYLANYGGTTESIQEAFETFTKAYDAASVWADGLKLDEYAQDLRDLEDGGFMDKVNEFLAFFVDIINGTLGVIISLGSFILMLLLHGFPIVVGMLKDLVFVMRVIIVLLFGAGVPT